MAVYISWGNGDEDATVQGAEWLKRNVIAQQRGPQAEKEFSDAFKAIHIDNQQSRSYDYGPVFELFCEYSEDLFAVIPNKDGEARTKEVESFFSLVLSMLPQFEDPQHLDSAVSTLCKIFSSSSEQHPELRLRLLMMLYNTFTTPLAEIRYRVFKYVLDYSAKAGLFDQMLPYLDYLDSWMLDWEGHLTMDDKRTLFLDISKFLRTLGKRIDAFQFLKRYHFLFQGATEQELTDPTVQEASLLLVKDTLQIQSVIQFDDILALDTVQALKKTKHAALVDLCDVFLLGGVNDLRAFKDKNPKLFDEHELSFADAMAKIRLLALATAVHGKSEMSLTEVAAILEENEDNVERWVVRALSEGVIDGRIDQLNNKVLVKSAFQRKFGKEEWSFLDAKLTHWIDNLENVIKFIGEQKKNAPAMVA
mmetsp:Transcript_20180/g.36560  ORF Transcript_20180/g.36560 Transcript_20180/m.36560 type:complete len:420 (-) Transcript_20180:32-1291(-)